MEKMEEDDQLETYIELTEEISTLSGQILDRCKITEKQLSELVHHLDSLKYLFELKKRLSEIDITSKFKDKIEKFQSTLISVFGLECMICKEQFRMPVSFHRSCSCVVDVCMSCGKEIHKCPICRKDFSKVRPDFSKIETIHRLYYQFIEKERIPPIVLSQLFHCSQCDFTSHSIIKLRDHEKDFHFKPQEMVCLFGRR
jgi:hypothetical protein